MDEKLDIEYLESQQSKYEQARDRYVEWINNSETEAVRHLIQVATILVTASLFLLQSDERESLGYTFQGVLFSSWILLGASVLAGIFIFVTDIRFFDTWATVYQKIAKAISNGKVKNSLELKNFSREVQKGVIEQTDNYLLYFQIITFILGIFGLFVVISRVIF